MENACGDDFVSEEFEDGVIGFTCDAFCVLRIAFVYLDLN